jgi:hypothetical protein
MSGNATIKQTLLSSHLRIKWRRVLSAIWGNCCGIKYGCDCSACRLGRKLGWQCNIVFMRSCQDGEAGGLTPPRVPERTVIGVNVSASLSADGKGVMPLEKDSQIGCGSGQLRLAPEVTSPA